MLRVTSALICCLLVTATAGAGANTLFLAHFDKSLDADYAVGGLAAAQVAGGARVSEPGYFPPGAAADLGYDTPLTAQVTLPIAGCLDVRQGTIEFFVKTKWDFSAEGIGHPGHPQFFRVPLQEGGDFMVYVYQHESGYVGLAFNLSDGRTDHALTAGVGPVGKREVEQPWKADEWHHVAVSWTPNWSRIFADGKQVAFREWNPALALPPVQGPLWLGGRETGATRVLIDELRIQDIPSEQVTVPTEPYALPTATTSAGNDGAPWATLPCYRTAQPPVLDGRLDDPIWKQVPWVGGFKRNAASAIFVPVPTRFALAWDDRALYLAAVCSEPNMAGLRAQATGRDGHAYGDDALELFLDPLRRHLPYYQMVFNTIGTLYDGKNMDATWNGDWQARVVKEERQWTAEMVVPFAAFEVTAQAGQVWGFNVARDRYASGGLDISTWSPLTGFHNPRSFGAFRLEAGLPRNATAEEGTLNAAYLKETQGLVQSSLKLWQRQTARLQRQLSSRTVPAKLRTQVQSLSAAVQTLEKVPASLTALDAARLTMLGLAVQMDEVVAQMQQSVPLGPDKPPADLKPGVNRRGDLWYFMSEPAIFAVDGKSGTLVGLWERSQGTRMIVASADHYWAETVASTAEADELDDTVSRSGEKEGRLALACANPDLPGARLVKEYWLRPEGMLARRVTVSGRPAEKTLLRISSRTYFDETFRQGSYYQRLLHPGISVDSVRKATSITAAYPQPGFMGQCPDGCSQFCASNLDTGVGVGQFLLKVNDLYAYPPRALNMSYWTPWGWEMSWLATFLKPEPFSAETEFMVYTGDHFTFHTRYLDLPEWKALHDEYQICPWVKKTRMVTMPYVGWSSFPGGNAPLHPDIMKNAQIPVVLQRPDEMMLYLQQQPGDNWGEWPAADGEVVRFRERNTDKFSRVIPAEQVKHGITRFHGLGIPHYKLGFYQFCLDVSPGTPAEQAGWYVVDKRGNPLSGYWDPSVKTYMTDMTEPYIEYTVNNLARVLDYYNTDFLYIDWPYPPCFADWKGEGRVTQPTDAMEFFRRVHRVCQERGKALMINSGAGVPFADAGIFEGVNHPEYADARGYLKDGWRNLMADPVLMMKLYEPPGFASHLWPWVNTWSDPLRDNSREMTNYCLLLGMRTSAGTNSEWDDQLKAYTPPSGQPEWLANARTLEPYKRGSFELSPSRVVEVGISPCWWREETHIEAYALQMGPAHVLTCLNHYPQDRAVTLTARRDRLALEPGKRTFVWVFNVRPRSSLVRQPDPPPANWDRLCLEITCKSALQDQAERISVDLGSVPSQLVRLAAVTQVPGFLVSAHGQDTQFLLPHNLGCTIDGATDEVAKTVRLAVKADKPCEILAWWPPAWGNAQAEITGAAAQARGPVPAEQMVTYGTERFARIALPAGDSTVVLSVGG